MSNRDPEHRISAALSAQAGGGRGGRSAFGFGPAEPAGLLGQAAFALVLALLGGAVLGVALALLSLLVPGLLPALG